MEAKQQKVNQYFLLGLGLVSLFAYTLLFCTIAFIRGYSISYWQFPAALAMMLVTQYFASRELFSIHPRQVFLKSSAILLALVFISIIISNAIYDVSFDGQWYHQETILRLKKGWNPYLKELPVPKMAGIPSIQDVYCSGPHVTPTENPGGDQPVLYIKYVSVNYFSKGAEIAQAAIYAMTRRIETGKALNVICLLASLFLCLAALYKLTSWHSKKIWLMSLLLTLNPVTIYQLTSYCLDGMMYSMMLCLFAVFVLIYLEKTRYTFFIFGLLVMIGLNIKFTDAVYTPMFCMGFFIFLLIKKEWLLVRKILLAGTISFLIGFVFIGFHPYITSLIKFNYPFHGLEDTRNVNQGLKPEYLQDKNRFVESFASYGARSYDSSIDGRSSLKTILKVPFSLSKPELQGAANAELKMAGFGPFFGGAVCICLLLLVLISARNFKNRSFQIYAYITGFLLLTVFIMPDPWWARFVPQLWLFPILLIILLEYSSLKRNVLKFILYGSVVFNIIWALVSILLNILITAHVNYQIAQLKTLTSPISVEYCGYEDMRSNAVRFEEHDIPYVEKFVTGKHIYNVIHSSTRFETSEELPAVPKSFLMQLNDKLHGKNAE
jgi:hypothetical protein